jgi:selenoprotein W-related protein
VALLPAEITGRYTISIDDNVIFDRKTEGRFPEIKELKQLVRDIVNPAKNLGHSEKKS